MALYQPSKIPRYAQRLQLRFELLSRMPNITSTLEQPKFCGPSPAKDWDHLRRMGLPYGHFWALGLPGLSLNEVDTASRYAQNFYSQCQLLTLRAQGRINNLLQRLVLLGFGPFLLSTLCFAASVIQLYFRTRVKRFFPGYRRRRADILLYTEQSDDEYLISNTWFDIVDLVSKTDDQREAIFKPNDWIQKFMEVPQLGKSHELSPEEFGTARAKFNENPGDFVRCLEKFSHDLHIRDLAESILVYCTDPSQTPEERRKRLQCWLTLNAKIHEINNRVLDPPATTAAYTYPEPDGIRTILDELKAQRGLENTGDELLRFFNKCIVDYIPQEDESRFSLS